MAILFGKWKFTEDKFHRVKQILHQEQMLL